MAISRVTTRNRLFASARNLRKKKVFIKKGEGVGVSRRGGGELGVVLQKASSCRGIGKKGGGRRISRVAEGRGKKGEGKNTRAAKKNQKRKLREGQKDTLPTGEASLLASPCLAGQKKKGSASPMPGPHKAKTKSPSPTAKVTSLTCEEKKKYSVTMSRVRGVKRIHFRHRHDQVMRRSNPAPKSDGRRGQPKGKEKGAGSRFVKEKGKWHPTHRAPGLVCSRERAD